MPLQLLTKRSIMGNICHAGPVLRDDTSVATAAAVTPKRAPNFGRDPSLKKEDYIFSNITGPASRVKLPGSINGQQFLVADCTDCDIFLLDNCASVQIDDCTNCRIVVGPCESSLFLRNCKNCTIVCAVQQFRTRDCDGVDVYLYSATEPIIELSTKMRFACFPLSYFSFQQQMDRAHFSVWNNRWSEIYNFTPDHGTWKTLPTSCSISPLAPISEASDVVALWGLPPETAQEVGLTAAATELVVPLTAGMPARREDASTLVVVFATPHSQLMLPFVHAMVAAIEGEPVILTRTKQIKLSVMQAKALLSTHATAQSKAIDAATTTAGSVVVEFQGQNCYARLAAVRSSSPFAGDATFSSTTVFSPNDSAARRMSEQVFVEWKETV